MKAVLLLVLSAVLCNTVNTYCTACKYGTPESYCVDEFIPSGHESDICAKINVGLCRKYGDYAIYCQTGGYRYSCQKRGHCVNEAMSLTPTLFLISVIIALGIKMKY